MIIYYKQKVKKSKSIRRCYWCSTSIPTGEEYIGVSEVNSDGIKETKTYRIECNECNQMLDRLHKTEYAYEAFYNCNYKETIKKYLRDIRCEGCVHCEEHAEEGFLIKCERRMDKNET